MATYKNAKRRFYAERVLSYEITFALSGGRITCERYGNEISWSGNRKSKILRRFENLSPERRFWLAHKMSVTRSGEVYFKYQLKRP